MYITINVFFLSLKKRAAITDPMGMEMIHGVINAIPIKPKRFFILIILLFPFEWNFLTTICPASRILRSRSHLLLKDLAIKKSAKR